MNLFVPSSVIDSEGVTQLVVLRLPFCCNVNPVAEDGQETMTVFVGVRRIFNEGKPGVGTVKTCQNPPLSE